MEITYKPKALKDIAYFKKTGNKQIMKKISKLISEMEIDPKIGTGKVEQLKHDLSGYWSRRINSEHRIIYKIIDEENRVDVYSLKGHYE